MSYNYSLYATHPIPSHYTNHAAFFATIIAAFKTTVDSAFISAICSTIYSSI